jgi:hypothetical protein
MPGDRKQAQTLDQLFGLSFIAVANVLQTYETARESWHVAAIVGHTHTHSSKVFPFTALDAHLLQTKDI